MKRGVLFTGTHPVSYSHTDEDIDRTLEVYGEALSELADAYEQGDVEERLDGESVGATLRKRTRRSLAPRLRIEAVDVARHPFWNLPCFRAPIEHT